MLGLLLQGLHQLGYVEGGSLVIKHRYSGGRRMGEIMLISMTSTRTPPMELRSLADWVARPRLLGVAGVSQVSLVGGEVREFQVLVDPARLAHHGLAR